MENIVLVALGWGVASAISLPLGAALGLVWKPSRLLISAMMSFGAGALLFALTIELFGSSLEHGEKHGTDLVLMTVGAAIVGGLFFHLANKILNGQGAFVRNFSNTKKWLLSLKRRQSRHLIQELSENKLIRALPPEEMAQLVPLLRKQKFDQGEIVFEEGEMGDGLYLLAQGGVEVVKGGEKVADLSVDDVFGEMALVRQKPRVATARATSETILYFLDQKDFKNLEEKSQHIQQALAKMTNERLEELSGRNMLDVMEEKEWADRALQSFNSVSLSLSATEVKEEQEEWKTKPHGGMAVWLGLLIDGLPESLVIGLLCLQPSGMSLAFVAGVFLANFPEALSGAASMSESGMRRRKIMWMWFSLTIMMGAGAAIGAAIFPPNPDHGVMLVIAAIEGLAAGAMLTAIAESFLPEAYERGGDIVGLTTLAGFLSALMVKLV